MTTNNRLLSGPGSRPDKPPPTEDDIMRGHDRRITERATWLRSQVKATDREGIERCWRWERAERQEVGLAVRPIEKPLTKREIEQMPSEVLSLGLSYGFLVRRADGSIFEVQDQ